MVNGWFEQLAARVRRKHVNATLLAITLDPHYDTPRVMAAEARALGADPRLWRVASGSVAYVLNARGKVEDVELPSAAIVDETVAALEARR